MVDCRPGSHLSSKSSYLFLQNWSYFASTQEFLGCPSILSRYLSSYRQANIMSHPSVTFDFFQSLDSKSYFSLEIVFQDECSDFITYFLLLFFSDIFDLFHAINFYFCKNSVWFLESDTIDSCQSNPDRFIFWKDMSHKSKHTCNDLQNIKLALSYFVSRIFFASNVENTFSLDYLTVHASFLKWSLYFHANVDWYIKGLLLIIVISKHYASLIHIILIDLNLYSISGNDGNIGSTHSSRFLTADKSVYFFEFDLEIACW